MYCVEAFCSCKGERAAVQCISMLSSHDELQECINAALIIDYHLYYSNTYSMIIVLNLHACFLLEMQEI